jgi:hypothetical protein
MARSSLDDVFMALQAALGGNQLSLGPVVTRVLLRTGVNLKAIRPDQAGDPAVITKVCGVLADMGYAV